MTDEQEFDDHGLEETTERMERFLAEYGIKAHGSSDMGEAINRIQLLTLAASRCMLDVVREDPDERSYLESLKEARHRHLQRLWLSFRLDTPWGLLVDKEFPGDPPTSADFEKYAGETAKVILDDEHARQVQDEARNDILATLVTNDYELEEEDIVVVVNLGAKLALFRAVSRGGVHRLSPEQVMEYRATARETINEEASEADHPAWELVIDECYPLKDS
jgi:hypothetical protein